MTASLFPANLPLLPLQWEESSPQKCCHDGALLLPHLLQGRDSQAWTPGHRQVLFREIPPRSSCEIQVLVLKGCHSDTRKMGHVGKNIIEGFSESGTRNMEYSKEVCRNWNLTGGARWANLNLSKLRPSGRRKKVKGYCLLNKRIFSL